MKFRDQRSTMTVAILLALLLTLGSSVVYADGPHKMVTYRVTIKNGSRGQPLSPPVAATHKPGIQMFRVRAPASSQLEAIAEDGNQIQMFDLFSASDKVTEVVNVGTPLTPRGHVVGDFTDSVTFEITAYPNDRFSLATMLICTNDGFTGLDRVRLPMKGHKVYQIAGYDAGTEDNTEKSPDIVDACSDLGRVVLAGDPNGNEDAAVDTDPQQLIRHHPGIRGVGDLQREHRWRDPVAVVIIKRVH